MKKVFSLLLAVLLVVSALPVAYATETADYTDGTVVSYTAANVESWSVTVPAKLAPGGSGTVTLQGAWPSNKLVTVSAQSNVVLTNNNNSADQKSLDVSFAGISEFGSDTQSQTFTENVSVSTMPADALFGKWTGHFYYTVGTQEMDILEQLQAKHEFQYYSTMNLAVTDVNNGTIGASADVDKEDAVAGVYTYENGGVNVVLLKNHTVDSIVRPSVDMTINLGGNTLYASDVLGIEVMSGHVTIDGRLSGSSVRNENADLAYAYAIKNAAGAKLSILGGTYSGSSNNNFAVGLSNVGDVTLNDCSFIANSDSGTTVAINNTGTMNVSSCDLLATTVDGPVAGINSLSGYVVISDCNISASTDSSDHCEGIYVAGTASITNCNILASNNSSVAFGFRGKSDSVSTITNCNIKAYANYLSSDESYDDSYSAGILSNGTLTLNDCYVMGTHSGVSNQGTLYVNGGTYEGYGHGGFYFGGTGTTSYVRNATIRQCAMPDGYTANVVTNGAGFYIGGDAGRDNISVHMDNCDIYGSANQIILRGTDGEQNNSLYISNSNVYDMDGDTISIRIDNDTHRLYIGTGNNFTVDNATTWGTITDWNGIVINTDETYIYNG